MTTLTAGRRFLIMFTLVAIAALAIAVLTAPFSPAFAQDDGPPARPTGLTAQAAHDSVSLSWDNPADESITGYRILRRNRAVDDPGVFRVHVQDTGSPGASYTDARVEPEARYVYRIRAIDTHGLSPQSGYVNADTPAAPEETEEREEALPDAPTGLVTAAAHDRSYSPGTTPKMRASPATGSCAGQMRTISRPWWTTPAARQPPTPTGRSNRRPPTSMRSAP